MLTGIIGKPNVGKSTFFNSATLLNVAVANYPFTTINPNMGNAYIRVKCVHEELGVKDNPVNSACVDGTRLIPVRLVDVAGLVPGASSGRGLGNKFLDDLRQADALIHVIDASGATDEEGRVVKVGTRDPAEDIEFIRREFVLWVKSLLDKDWPKITRAVESGAANSMKLSAALLDKLSGLSIYEEAIEVSVHKRGLKIDKPSGWGNSDLYGFCETLLEISKPILIAANKCDLPTAKETINRLSKELGDSIIVPCAAEAELLLRRASQINLISYLPGDASFRIKDESRISSAQRKALDLVKSQVLDVWHGTGVQSAINDAYLRLLKGIVVYPVEDETKYSDKKGNVLPDARIMHKGDTAKDLAFKVHTDLGNAFLYAIDARTSLRVGAEYQLKNNDVLKIVSSARKG
ncbi:MAG TPA: redox-regulated ATPase YchF [Nitrososphaerales archaeon]|nr:redox-regulated ATPase YchF [Nitrososphaerales archaeon]